MHDQYIHTASIPFHSNSVQAAIGTMLGSISAWVRMLDYDTIARVTAIITLAYIVFAFTMAIERRLRQTRYVNAKEMTEFKKWKRQKILQEMDMESTDDKTTPHR